MNLLKLQFALSLIICIVTSNAQTPEPVTNSNVSDLPAMKSPTASEFGKFGNIPVSKFTGTPSITIPLTEISNGSIKVPIYLQYNAVGCRPDAHPTWVGLNWSLNAGGVITRTTNGRIDELNQIGAPNYSSYLDKYWMNALNDWNQASNVNALSEREDRAPDEFTFSFAGLSGSFFLNNYLKNL